jgi:hypothetical protein
MADPSQQLSGSDAHRYVSRLWWGLIGLLEVVLSILAFPILILLVGLPVVLLVRLMIEIVQMLS